MPVSLTHIINPFRAPKGSDLELAIPVTLESMRIAAAQAGPDVEVSLLSAQFAEDREVVPSWMRSTEDLSRDVTELCTASRPIRLPFIADILQRAYDNSTDGYLVYTNADIGLQPHFYSAVAELIRSGLDAFIINRRRIPAKFSSVDELPLMWKEKGKRHPGFDCFVFRREMFPRFILEDICIGVPFLEISFAHNLFAFAERFRLLEDEHLTFHLGMEIFRRRAPAEYLRHNRDEFGRIFPQLRPWLHTDKLPYAALPLPLRILRRGLHPCMPVLETLKLEWDAWKR